MKFLFCGKNLCGDEPKEEILPLIILLLTEKTQYKIVKILFWCENIMTK